MTRRLETVIRYCPNVDCPALRIKGEPRFLCETEAEAYLRIRCPSCKTWWVWEDGKLTERGTLILEDVAVA